MKKFAITVAFGASLGLSAPSHASGIPTVDVAALAQNIIDYSVQLQQFEEALNQVQNGVRQIQEAERAYESLNGLRNMGDILDFSGFQDYRNVIPTDWQERLSMMEDLRNSDYNNLPASVEAILSARQRYDLNETGLALDSEQRRLLAQDQAMAAVDMEVTGLMLNSVDPTKQVLDAYIERIDQTPDPKGIADLTAHIGAQNAVLTNNLIQLMAYEASQKAEREMLDAEAKERALYLMHKPFDSADILDRARAQANGGNQ